MRDTQIKNKKYIFLFKKLGDKKARQCFLTAGKIEKKFICRFAEISSSRRQPDCEKHKRKIHSTIKSLIKNLTLCTTATTIYYVNYKFSQ